MEEVKEGDPLEIVVENARRKARAVAAGLPLGSLVLGADTEVACGGAVLGKPGDAAGAARRLRQLSGRTHEVLGGVVLIGPGGESVEVVRTLVTFRPLTELDVERYVAWGEWEDRAGGYAIQGLGSSLAERVEGDLSNVIGLPMPTVSRMIAKLQER